MTTKAVNGSGGRFPLLIQNGKTTESGLLGSIAVTLPVIISPQYPDPWNNVRIYFYYGDGNLQNTSYQLKDANQLLNHPVFDINKLTTLYVHGYTESQASESIQVVKNSYSYLPNYNFLALDYSLYVEANIKSIDYISAYQAVPYLAPYITEALLNLFNAGLPLQDFHLVGHSLGSQLSGYIGREIIQQSGGSLILPRISGLDPANPGYYDLPIDIIFDHLGPSDAVFVDVIHTDAGLLGAPYSTGTVDFWPNGGYSVQSGCPVPRHLFTGDDNDCCSHWRSWRFWAESVANLYQQKFIANKADSYTSYLLGFYEDETAIMGLHVSLE
ncbi:pancreatic triacylglycerol lipase-like [Condylostylus longicornis]|uniref:pancreatic triacylglycerol lipase-like n=1 Tax=Condylostylus longicornis TaxID=2530218 RepID=UPI00244E3506|nr:pancreatic triacylglycerol lipase-like [Condylostylus longicornis]